ncbi:MAG: hypothetical protein K2X64_09095 [Rhodocyclaceae bacterium]|nr:hypothetical protein [Rhodocyclaceae bacterium]
MTMYPVINYQGFSIVVNTLLIGGRHFGTFSIHEGDIGTGSVVQLPAIFQIGHLEAPSFGTDVEALDNALQSAKFWIDAKKR